MLYYKVKEKYDQVKLPKRDIYIKDEILTIKEIIKYEVNMNYVEPVELSPKETYWFFGARFALTNEY